MPYVVTGMYKIMFDVILTDADLQLLQLKIIN